MSNDAVVFRRTKPMIILMSLIFVVAIIVGVYFIEVMLWKVLWIVFLSIAGILTINSSLKPIVIISKDGITIPTGNKENFVAWSNVKRIGIFVQTTIHRHDNDIEDQNPAMIHQRNNNRTSTTKQSYIGISVFDDTGIFDPNKFSQNLSEGYNDWEETPAILINNAFSGVKLKDIMAEIERFYNQYKDESI